MRAAPLVLAALLLASAAPVRADEPGGEDEVLVPGHQVRMLSSGRVSFRVRARNIAEADVILLKTYNLMDDATGRETVAALCARARAGAQVFVQYDVKGSNHSVRRVAAMALGLRSEIPDHLRPLLEAGATLIPTSKPRLGSLFLGRDHDKLVVTWKRGEPVRVIAGGMNIGDIYRLGGVSSREKPAVLGLRDTDLELSGPETAHVVARFVEAAQRAGTPALPSLRKVALELFGAPQISSTAAPRRLAAARFVSNDPGNRKDDRRIERFYEQLIGQTPVGETITISNGYFLAPRRLQKAILANARRGVRFRFLINAFDSTRPQERLVSLAFRDQLRSLLRKAPEGSIEVQEFTGNAKRNEGALHEKMAKFGANGPVLVGSANLDLLSANHNSEAVVVVQHPRIGRQFDAIVARSFREGTWRKIDRAVLKRDSLSVKLKGFFLNRVLGRIL